MSWLLTSGYKGMYFKQLNSLCSPSNQFYYFLGIEYYIFWVAKLPKILLHLWPELRGRQSRPKKNGLAE